MPTTFYTEDEVKALRSKAVEFAKGYHKLINLADRLYDTVPLLDDGNSNALREQESSLTEVISDFERNYHFLSDFCTCEDESRTLDNYVNSRFLTTVPLIIARIRQVLRSKTTI